MLNYFNLNKRAGKKSGTTSTAVIERESVADCDVHRKEAYTLAKQIFMYLGTLIGVVFSNAVDDFRTGKETSLGITSTEILVSAVIALIIIPAVYEKLKLDPKAPLLVQFGFFVQNGVFWQVLISYVGRVLP